MAASGPGGRADTAKYRTAEPAAMSDDDHGHDVERDDRYPPGETRTTSPMQPYGARAVGIGLAVLAVGLAVAYVLPFLA